MKYMSKSELAQMAGVSYSTFQRWMRVHDQELQQHGVSRKTRLLSPRAVRYICYEYGIDEGSCFNA